jgi:hypothetical protein
MLLFSKKELNKMAKRNLGACTDDRSAEQQDDSHIYTEWKEMVETCYGGDRQEFFMVAEWTTYSLFAAWAKRTMAPWQSLKVRGEIYGPTTCHWES